MNTDTRLPLDFSSDMLELGLVAFASPDFADALVRELLALDATPATAGDSDGSNKDRIAA